MPEQIPSWIPSFENPRLLGIAGWSKRLFALVDHEDGASLCFHDGEVRSAATASELVADCSEDERSLLGVDALDLGGDRAAAAAQLQALGIPQDEAPPPWAGFFWWADPQDVRRACAVELPPVEPAEVPGSAAHWRLLQLGLSVPHPAGVEVDVLPVMPGAGLDEKSDMARTYRLIANRLVRVRQLQELDAPPSMLTSEREALASGIADLVARARRPAPTPPPPIQRASARTTPLLEPPTGPGTGLFRVPYHDPGLYVVQRADALRVVSTEEVLYELPPCPLRPLFGSGRLVVFAGDVASGPAPRGVAILDIEEGRWMTRWPDEQGLRFVHGAWLPEEDGHGAAWLVDPRVPTSRVLPGRAVAHQAEFGREQLVRDGGGTMWLTAPSPDGLTQARLVLPETPPSWRVHARTGEVFAEPWNSFEEGKRPPELERPWTPAQAPLGALSRSAYGALLVSWRGALFVDDERIALVDGPVQAVALEGGNSTRNGYLALLTEDGVLCFCFEAHGEDARGSMTLDHRIPC